MNNWIISVFMLGHFLTKNKIPNIICLLEAQGFALDASVYCPECVSVCDAFHRSRYKKANLNAD